MVDTRSAAASAPHDVWIKRTAKAGFAASGVLHFLIAFIVARLASGDGGNADQSGALAVLAAQPGGAVMLWVAAVVLAALGVWYVAETFLVDDAKHRVKSVAVGVVYLSLAFSAAKFAMGSGKSSGQRNAGLSAQLMQTRWGNAVLVAIALVVLGVGGYHVYKGVSKKFLKDLDTSSSTSITWVGIVGYVAKGLVLFGAGILVLVATFTSDPAKASGIVAAVKTLGGAPFGKFLLIIAALGLAAYGAYGLIRSRHAVM
jgi:hypothetical protein